MPFNGRSAVITIAHDNPSSTSQKYSNEENRSAKSASAGADTISTAVPNNPPSALNTRPAPSASSVWPLRVIAYASSVYAADAGVPGIRSRQPGTSPAKIAIAVADTIAAIAGIGGMKNVTGTRSAVAIVAVRPGTAPTKSPNSDAAIITHRLYGSKTSCSATATSCIALPRIACVQDARDQNAKRCSTPHGSGTRSNL